MKFASCLHYFTSGTTKLLQFYYFLKELHEQIVCTNQLFYPILNFITPLERVLFDETKSFNELKEFFITHCTKIIICKYFIHRTYTAYGYDLYKNMFDLDFLIKCHSNLHHYLDQLFKIILSYQINIIISGKIGLME